MSNLKFLQRNNGGFPTAKNITNWLTSSLQDENALQQVIKTVKKRLWYTSAERQ